MGPSVAILLSTFDGARFLRGQLDSYRQQTHAHWRLVAADDGSTDDSRSILMQFQNDIGPDKVTIRSGPGKGFVANFLSLACEPGLSADYFAFSDQDDVWEADKLSRALAWFATVPAGVPAVYGSRTRLIDTKGRTIGRSPLFRKPPSFANALVQNIAGGNTMIFNEAARQLLIPNGGLVDVPSHDWWLYLVTSAHGGRVYYDRYCSVYYRRHDKNLVGLNIGLIARLRRARMLLEGRFKRWTDLNVAALRAFCPHMRGSSRKIFIEFREARRQSLLKRVLGVKRSGVYRQTFVGRAGLFLGLVLNKI